MSTFINISELNRFNFVLSLISCLVSYVLFICSFDYAKLVYIIVNITAIHLYMLIENYQHIL